VVIPIVQFMMSLDGLLSWGAQWISTVYRFPSREKLVQSTDNRVTKKSDTI